MRIGVLALQGAFEKHIKAIESLEYEAVPVKTAQEIESIDGLIIPGGESTTIGKLLQRFDLDKVIIDRARKSMPIFGTCTGLILLAKEIISSDQPKLGLMDIVVERNAFGRQIESFETDLNIPILGSQPFRAVFIRAPVIESASEGVEILARFEDKIVFARQKNLLASAFHPELTEDLRIHRLFLDMVHK